MTIEEFCDTLGELFVRLGYPPLEGRFVALLLCHPEPLTLGAAASLLGVSKVAVSSLANRLVAAGDVKLSQLARTKQHAYAIADDAYLGDLRKRIEVSNLVVVAVERLLRGPVAADGALAGRLRHYAGVHERAAATLEAVLAPADEERRADLEEHLRDNPDAVPPRAGAAPRPGRERPSRRELRPAPRTD